MDVAHVTRARHPASPAAQQGPRTTHESPAVTPEDVTDTSAALASTYARDTSATGVCVADGMGLRIS